MNSGLPVSLFVDVEVNLSAIQAQAPAVNTNLVIGTSNVIPIIEREREYYTIAEVAADFGTSAPEYLAALLWFGQNPQPTNLFIGRWAQAATAGQLIGGGVTAANLLISAWTPITSGSFTIFVDGIPYTLTGMNFSAVTNLNGVASVVQTALQAATSATQTVVYNSIYNDFIVTDSATGTSSVIGFATSPTAVGYAAFSGQPTANDTLTIDGTAVTFVSSGASGNQVNIGLSLAATLTALLTFLNSSTDAGLALNNYYVVGSTLYIVDKVAGASGNGHTLVKSSTAITLSGATLTGGGWYAGGYANFAGQPTAADTITVNGVSIEFVASGATGNQVNIGGLTAVTIQNLLTFLQGSTNALLTVMGYAASGVRLYFRAKVGGVGGNVYTLTVSSTNVTVSGGTLTGGTATDISGMLSLAAASSGCFQSPGIAAESAVTAVTTFDNMFSTQWYGLEVLGAMDSDHEAIAAYIEAAAPAHYYGVTTQEAGVLVATDTSDIAYVLNELGYNHTAVQYSSTSPYAIVSYLARILTTQWLGSNTTITLFGKQEPGVVAENISVTQYESCIAKKCNVYATINVGSPIIAEGTSASGQFTDTVIGADWMSGELQLAGYDAITGTPTKIPQTDAGDGVLVAAYTGACQLGVTNGYAAPGQWNSAGFGALQQGQNLPAGYYVYIPLIATQSEAVRQTRAAPVCQIAMKCAGAIQSSDVVFNVNQ
jgi:hypothetical protein